MTRPSGHFDRRRFLELTATATGALALGACSATRGGGPEVSSGPEAALPKGAAPQALNFPHFPDRLHAYVWRNWPLVPAERMARVVRARKADIERLAHAMGLGRQPAITADLQERSYITVIKRNWHLLPYEQLLTLLGWTPAQMAFTLREDDFLFVKLGNLKPACEPLRYEKPTASADGREAEIARCLRHDLPEIAAPPSEPLFEFVRTLSRKPPKRARVSQVPAENLRFCYSYFALYGDPLLETKADPYPEGYLARLADAGVSGVWMQAVLYKLALFPWDTSLSAGREERLENLRKLIERAARHGLQLFLYLNEPRSMPAEFFTNRPELKGVIEGEHATLCTSIPAVQKYLTDSVESICRAAPGLGGFFTITASENLTNCWSHGAGAQCTRCGSRPAAEVIAEVNRLLYEGVRKASSAARFIAWDWGWNDTWAPDAIARLPEGMRFMSVSEWRLPVERGGVRTEVGEYSISAVGPGPRARGHWQHARERGLACVAKVQAGNTWELSSVPWIPAVANVAQHAQNLHGIGIRDVMLGWTLGGCPSPNLEVVREVLAGRSATEAMRIVAERWYGPTLAAAVVRSWQDFSAAFSEFPYHGGTLYSGPQQVGPTNLLWATPTRFGASMVGFPYDDLDAWRSVYPADIFVGQLEKVARGFAATVERLKALPEAARASAAERTALNELTRLGEAVAIHFQSAANQARFVQVRRQLDARPQAGPSVASLRNELKTVIENEIGLARRLWEIQRQDSRIGFEASNQYYYVPVDLAEKIINCRYLLEHWLPSMGDGGAR